MIFYLEELLKENGIDIPRTPILGSMFERKWSAAEQAYSVKMQNWHRAKTEWEELYRETIKKDWGVDVEYPSFEAPWFTTPEEAITKISKIPAPTSRDLYYSTVNNERTKWVQELIANAPEGATIYIRSTDYFTQTAYEYFKKRMAAKEKACVSMCGIAIVYIGFRKTRPLDELKVNLWSIVKERATVEYVK